MTITCPKCGFSRTLEATRVPAGPVAATCPRCQEKFTLRREESGEAPPEPPSLSAPGLLAAEGGEPSPGPEVRCPVCGQQQPPAERCVRCGAAFGAGPPRELQPPFAGFWRRVAATIIDSVLVSVVQFSLALLLAAGIRAMTGPGAAPEFLLDVFKAVLAAVYFVFFTGYTGQTPGKMTMKIKVVRTNGTSIGYGRAFLREVIGKFLSGVLLGIGYLMVAFDSRKQGLHDKIADTLVIKI